MFFPTSISHLERINVKQEPTTTKKAKKLLGNHVRVILPTNIAYFSGIASNGKSSIWHLASERKTRSQTTTWQFYEISIDKCFLICIWIDCISIKHISWCCFCCCSAPSTVEPEKLYDKNYARIHYNHFGPNLFTFFSAHFSFSLSLSFSIIMVVFILSKRQFSQFTPCKLFAFIFL